MGDLLLALLFVRSPVEQSLVALPGDIVSPSGPMTASRHRSLQGKDIETEHWKTRATG
jgi:hypothetical protein